MKGIKCIPGVSLAYLNILFYSTQAVTYIHMIKGEKKIDQGPTCKTEMGIWFP